MPRNDHTGVPQTCPMIDEVIRFMASIDWSEEEGGLEHQCQEAIKTMEKIRSANSDLRDFGNRQYDTAVEHERNCDYYESKVRELETEVDSLKDELATLEKEFNLLNQ